MHVLVLLQDFFILLEVLIPFGIQEGKKLTMLCL